MNHELWMKNITHPFAGDIFLFINFMKIKHLLLTEAIQLFIAASASGKRKKSAGNLIIPAVVAQYRQVEKCLASFETYTNKQFVIQCLHGTSALRWNKEKRYWKKFLDTFLNYGRSQMHWSDSYLGNQLKVIKAVFNYLAYTRGYPVGNFHSSFVVHAWQPPPHVIMPGRFQWLIMHNNDFCKQLKPKPANRT
jgi:hypothetical protein